MRDANRLREKFQLALDGRQVASVVVGALVILGGVFVLGLNVGRELALRQAPAAPAPADALAALDAPPPSADAGEPPRLSYHEALTRPAEPPAPAPRPAAPASPRPTPAPAAAPSPAAVPPERAATDPSALAEEARGAFTIQVGASQDRAEAQRILDRFKGHRGRIVAAEIPRKGRWYRVRLGAFETKEAAERYLSDLSRETGARGFVAPND
jgi:cell division septation protein DedD